MANRRLSFLLNRRHLTTACGSAVVPVVLRSTAAVAIFALFQPVSSPAFAQSQNAPPAQLYTNEDIPKPGKKPTNAVKSAIDPRLVTAVQLQSRKKIDKALNLLNAILSEKPDDVRALLVRGQIYMKEDRFDLAINDFTSILSRNPKNIAARSLRAKTYMYSKQFDKAVADCNHVLEQKPNDEAALYLRGTCRIYVFDVENGLRDLEKVKSQKEHAQVYFTSGAAYINVGRLNDAIANYSKTIMLNPRHGLAYMIRGRCFYNQGDYQKAIKDYSLALENNKGYWRIHMLRAKAYEKAGEHAKANRDLELATINEPDMAVGFYSSSVEDAVGRVRKPSTTRGASKSELLAESFKLRDRKDFAGALKVLERVLQREPTDASARYQHGKILMDMQNYDGAIKDFVWVVHSDSVMAEQISRLIAIAFYKNKDYQRAIWACNGALFWDEYWLEGYIYKAMALDAMKQTAEAKKFYKQFLSTLKEPKALKTCGASKTELAAWEKLARAKVR